MTTTGPATSNPRRRRRALSIRLLMLVIVAIGLFLGWMVNRARTQARAVARIGALGGYVNYEFIFLGMSPMKVRARVPGLAWLQRRIGDEYFQVVTSVDFHGQDLKDADLAVLADLDHLTAVCFSFTGQITDAGLVHLRGLKRLRDVNLIGTRVTGEGLVHLAALPRLESLSLSGGTTSSAALAHIGKMHGLRKLRTGIVQGEPGVLVELRSLTELTDLSMSGRSVTDAGADCLAGMRKLRKRVLPCTRITDASLVHIRKLQALESLDLTAVVDITNAGMSAIAGMETLRTLKVGGTQVTDSGLASLKTGFRTLNTLDLTSDRITNAGLVQLETLPGPLTVDLTQTWVTQEGIDRLAAKNAGVTIQAYGLALANYEKSVASGEPHGPRPWSQPEVPDLRRSPAGRIVRFLIGR